MLLATVFAGLFATTPNPTRVTWYVTLGYIGGMLAGFVCEFFVLTQLDGYGLLVIGVAPFLAVGLVMMMSPATPRMGSAGPWASRTSSR